MEQQMPKLILIAVLVLGFMPISAYASDYVEHEHVKARLDHAPFSINGAVLEIVLADGWHSYGDPPGDSGLPPRFDWTGSQNAEHIEVTLPPTTPKTEMGEFTVNSYSGEIAIPIKFTRNRYDEDSLLNLKLTLMICKDICIPETFELSFKSPGTVLD